MAAHGLTRGDVARMLGLTPRGGAEQEGRALARRLKLAYRHNDDGRS